MMHPSWVALQGMAHSFTELYKPICHKVVIHVGENEYNFVNQVYYNKIFKYQKDGKKQH